MKEINVQVTKVKKTGSDNTYWYIVTKRKDGELVFRKPYLTKTLALIAVNNDYVQGPESDPIFLLKIKLPK